ncbi:MAG: MarR family transcriptional regulator [Candidatus Peribacteraceae bacterium]|nr:MarR family transcriptional regulator [Candidatus Peribacteraceae bacterium]
MKYSNDLIDLTFEVTRHMRKMMVCMDKDDKSMNWLQMHALSLIADHEGITMKEVATFMKVSAPSATSFVNRLVKMKWVERLTDASNRKLVRLKMTQAGKQMLLEKIAQKKQMMHGIISLLSDEDQAQMVRIYKNLLTSLSRKDL